MNDHKIFGWVDLNTTNNLLILWLIRIWMQKGVRVTRPSFKILGPLSNVGKGEARNFKFGIQIDDDKYHYYHPMDDKLSLKERGQGYVNRL